METHILADLLEISFKLVANVGGNLTISLQH